MRRILFAAVVALIASPAVAAPVTITSTVDSLRYGINPKRVSVKLHDQHPGGPCANIDYYTFTGKPLWADAFLEAIENGLTVAVTGSGVCTLGVEEIAFFDIFSETSAAAKKKGAK